MSWTRGRWQKAPVALAALVAVGSCKESARDQPTARPVKLSRRRAHLSLSVHATSAARGADDSLAVGTADGRVLVVAGERTGSEGHERSLTREEGKPPHDGAVTGLAFGPDGKTLVSAGGHTVVWWQLDPPKPLQHLVGPQRLTGVVVEPKGEAALFSTAQGHVLRWKRGKQAADGVSSFACGGRLVLPSRRRLPRQRRCPYGSYQQRGGRGYCAYPVTQLVRRGSRVARACRTGRVSVLQLTDRRVQHLGGGALGALAFVGANRLLLARLDGQLWLYDLKKREVIRRFAQLKHPLAAASSGELIGVANRRKLAIYDLSARAPVASVKLPAKSVWLELTERTASVLAEGGRLISYEISR